VLDHKTHHTDDEHDNDSLNDASDDKCEHNETSAAGEKFGAGVISSSTATCPYSILIHLHLSARHP
jgi:hypothetical protein